jgi:predicted MarR family transcription regulator
MERIWHDGDSKKLVKKAIVTDRSAGICMPYRYYSIGKRNCSGFRKTREDLLSSLSSRPDNNDELGRRRLNSGKASIRFILLNPEP